MSVPQIAGARDADEDVVRADLGQRHGGDVDAVRREEAAGAHGGGEARGLR